MPRHSQRVAGSLFEIAAYVKSEMTRWGKVVRSTGALVD
jgi:hypothetical protein